MSYLPSAICDLLFATGHCAFPLSCRLPGSFAGALSVQEGKISGLWPTLEASADLSIFPVEVTG